MIDAGPVSKRNRILGLMFTSGMESWERAMTNVSSFRWFQDGMLSPDAPRQAIFGYRRHASFDAVGKPAVTLANIPAR